ncbi:MAG: hypothetical protein NTV87_00150, partial [Ignavibacteriae bacterium]|nr:hypothetical protein [Ignavibacteriota bacterium]
MRREYLFCLICVFFLCENACSQYNLYYQPTLSGGGYGPATQFVSSDVSSDFGRRTGDNTLWHKGVDYNHLYQDDDLGYHLLSPFGGLVEAFHITT